MKIAVIQHRLRAHERTDLAALLAAAEAASADGAAVVVCPAVPALAGSSKAQAAFIENVRAHAPGALVLAPSMAAFREGGPQALATPMGRTLPLVGDACIDPAGYEDVRRLAPDAMVWEADPESALQAEAVLEVALGASLSLAGLVLVAATVGRARGRTGFGGSAIVHLGEIVAEAGDEEETITATLDVPVSLPDRPGPLPVLPPILAQRLAHHRGAKASVDWPADLD